MPSTFRNEITIKPFAYTGPRKIKKNCAPWNNFEGDEISSLFFE